MVLVLVTAFLSRPFFRFNRFAALVAVYISNPFTMLPIFWFNYRVGAIFMRAEISWVQFVDLFQYRSISEWWPTFLNVFQTLGLPLIAGSAVVATFFALPTYPIMLRLLQRVQARSRKHIDQTSDTASSENSPNESVVENDHLGVS